MELTRQDCDTIQKCCFCWKVEPETALMGTTQQIVWGWQGQLAYLPCHNVSSSQTPWGLQNNLKIPWSVIIFLVKTKKLGASRILDTASGDESVTKSWRINFWDIPRRSEPQDEAKGYHMGWAVGILNQYVTIS